MDESKVEGTRAESAEAGEPFDAIVVGSGFGGAVAACRLAQAGKRVLLLERGRRYTTDAKGIETTAQTIDFPRWKERPDHWPSLTNWSWQLDRGLCDAEDLKGTFAVLAAGYGGGSLVYANVHLRPPAVVFREEAPWPKRAPDGSPLLPVDQFTPAGLAQFYDRVARTLRVTPVPARLDAPLAAAALREGKIPKLEALRTAAKVVGRSDQFFLPPLAIDFDKCRHCGECVVGCAYGAKNTLDLNYLQEAERCGLAVRTQCEVIRVGRAGSKPEELYEVTYTDHLLGRRDIARSKAVFLCAGAIHTTGILLRSRLDLGIDARAQENIGKRFFANGDAFALVVDTKEPAPTPSLGPTITSAIVYNGPAAGGQGDATGTAPWFIVQDGGYPKQVEWMFGLFRSPFWLDRNRFGAGSAKEGAESPRGEERARGAPALRSSEVASRHADRLLGFLAARTGTPGSAAGPAILPKQVKTLLEHLLQAIDDAEGKGLDSMVEETLAELKQQLPGANGTFSGPIVDALVSVVAEALKPRVLAASRAVVDRHLFGQGVAKGPNQPSDLLRLLLHQVEVGEAIGKAPDDRSFVLLTMGLDAKPGTVSLEDDGHGGDRLRVDWDEAANQPLATMQERLLRDLAAAMGGELRLNPFTTAQREPISVHLLGGCSMADDAAHGVTDSTGKVFGTRALYVLDGAAIPVSLGSNPSATIAAVAERNVRKALDEVFGFRDELPDPVPPSVQAQPVPPVPPDLIASLPVSRTEPTAEAIGLRFKEIMVGDLGSGAGANDPLVATLAATIPDLNAFLESPSHEAQLSGTVAIGSRDYAATGSLFLLVQRPDTHAAQLALSHHADLLKSRGARSPHGEHQAHEKLLERLRHAVNQYEMLYDLHLKGTDAHGQLEELRFKGRKRVVGGSSLSAWRQTTRMTVEIEAAQPPRHGHLQVHLGDLLRTQVPSFEVTGAQDRNGQLDDAQVAWALGRFFRFFFGVLWKVYAPPVALPNPFGDRDW